MLRPGELVLGYDLTETRTARLVHRPEVSPHRIIASTEMGEGMAGDGFVGIAVRTSLRSHLMRFKAEKTAN